MWYRPGPEQIEPARAPGGLVIRVYGEDGRLLLERLVPAGELLLDLDMMLATDVDAAIVEQQLADGEALCIVVFDGDSGARVSLLPPGRYEPGSLN